MTKVKMLNRNKIKCKKLKRNKMQENKRNKIKGQPKGQNYRRDQISKGLFRRDRKKREKKIIACQHKLNEGEERKVLWQLKRTFCVCNCDRWGLYL